MLAKGAMLSRSIVLAVLVFLASAPRASVWADEPGRETARVRPAPAARAAVFGYPAARAYAPARARVATVPPCEDVTTLLLSCVPRRPLPPDWPVEPVLAAIATASPPYARPYRQLFSWD